MKTFVKPVRKLALLVLCAALFLSACGTTEDQNNPARGGEGDTLPIYAVVKRGASSDEAAKLASVLELKAERLVDRNGIVDFIDTSRYQFVPTEQLGAGEPDEDKQETVLEAFNFEALKEIQAPEGEEVEALLTEALQGARLFPGDQFDILPILSHSEFRAESVEGETVAEQLLDTQVSYQTSLKGIPVKGPGAVVSASFDAQGVTKLRYAFRQLEAEGEAEVLSLEEAKERCGEALADSSFDALETKAEYVYYAPSLELNRAQLVLPHISCSGVARVGKEEVIPLERIIPAVVSEKFVPSAQLEVATRGSRVSANVSVKGGAEPYTVQWRSSNVAFPGDMFLPGDRFTYEVTAREAVNSETLTAIITDANGVSVEVSETFGVAAKAQGSGLAPQVGGVTDFGTENAVTNEFGALEQGFINEMLSDGVTKRFSWTGTNAWERDFKSPNDSSYVDNTDITFYVGHGYGNGFTFEDNSHDDGTLDSNDADGDWGDKDLEWLALLSCQVLKKDYGGNSVFDRWKQEFDGLHLLLGFHTNAYAWNSFSGEFANNLVDRNMTVRQSWFKAVDDAQPDGVDAMVMGVIGNGNIAAWNDHFWGRGSVSSDIRGSNITGYWYVSHVGN